MKAKPTPDRREAAVAKKVAVSRRPGNQHVFIYGTLKRGGINHGRLREHDIRFVRTGRIQAALYDLPGSDFPGALPANASNQFVKGELFELRNPQAALSKLDQFEGVDEGLFRRELVDVLGGRRPVRAWVYFYSGPVDHAERIPSGVFSSR
jgi:gamma-glutamylcyclotransferase (GGCT)/AIG2-like uncharacterized protein YtfP